MESREMIEAKQIEGIEQAMGAHDWRYPAEALDAWETWTLTLWGGLEIQIMATVAGAIKIDEASKRGGDDALFTIRGGW